MSIRGKTYFSLRLIGMLILFLISLVQFIADLLWINGILGKISLILLCLPWFIVYIVIKVELSPFSTHKLHIFSILILYWLMLNLLISIKLIPFPRGNYVILRGTNIIFILTSWNFSLSIYKTKKLIFVCSSAISIIFGIITQIYYPTLYSWVFNMFNLMGLFIGIFLILLTEYLLRKKGLLTYI
jgi:hypothetical protein